MQIRKKSPQVYQAAQNTGDLNALLAFLGTQPDFEHLEVRQDMKVRIITQAGDNFTLAVSDWVYLKDIVLDKISSTAFANQWEIAP